MKKIFQKIMILALAGILCLLPIHSIQAAPISYNKAMKIYSKALNSWIRTPRQVKITDDVRVRSGSDVFGNDIGKSVYLHKAYCSDMSYWMYEDLNGDGVPEYLAGLPNGQLIILTIYNNKAKVLAVLRTTAVMSDIYHNSQNQTFTIASSITARLVSRNVYKIRNGKLYRLATLSDAVGQMNGYGYVPVNRYLNGKIVSKKKYDSYYQKYCKNMRHIDWKRGQG